MNELKPWFSPKLSQAMVGVLNALGHTIQRTRGEEIYSSPGLFDKLMFIKRGFVAKALLDPVRSEPLLVSLSGKGALCGGFENLYVRDRLHRRHYCLTNSEILVVNKELLLRIADQNPEWQRELANYSAVAAICDRLGALINHAGALDQRFGALLLLMMQESHPEQITHIMSEYVEWVELTFMPGIKTLAYILDSDYQSVQNVIQSWVKSKDVRYRDGRVWLHRERFYLYWSWVNGLMREYRSATIDPYK